MQDFINRLKRTLVESVRNATGSMTHAANRLQCDRTALQKLLAANCQRQRERGLQRPRKSNGSQPRWRNSTAPIRAAGDCSVGLIILFPFPLREERPPLIGNGDRFSISGHGDVNDRRVTNHRASLIAHLLAHDEAGVADGSQAGADAEIIARESLRLIRCFDLSHHCPQTRSHVLFVRHVALERRPARALEQSEHVRVIDVPDRIAVAWIDVNLEVFHRPPSQV